MSIENFARLIPRGQLNTSGSVFYAGRRAFSTSSLLYILGANPGGDPQRQAKETVQWHTHRVLSVEPEDWSAYQDESWEGFTPGKYGMQPRVLHMFRRLKLDPRKVPSSNVVFLRSQRTDNLGSFRQYANECWPFHQRVIDDLGIRVILCFGQKAGNWVCSQLNASEQVEEFVERNNRKWASRCFRNTQGIEVVVATHPSIADWTISDTDPTELTERSLIRLGR